MIAAHENWATFSYHPSKSVAFPPSLIKLFRGKLKADNFNPLVVNDKRLVIEATKSTTRGATNKLILGSGA